MRYLVMIKTLLALALLWSCGGKAKVPQLVFPGGGGDSFSESGVDIEVTGQKGVGRREGNNFFKTFTVDNRKVVTESVPYTFKTETGSIKTIAGTKADNFTQATTATGNLFKLSSIPHDGQIQMVTVNGVTAPSGTYQYFKDGNGVYFPSREITAGSVVNVHYTTTHPSYAFSADTSAVGVSASDVAGTEVVAVKFEGNVIIVPNNTAVGTEIRVKYYTPSKGIIQGTLSFEPIAAEMLKIDLPECANAAITFNGKSFSADCLIGNMDLVPVIYSFADVKLQKFSMAEVEHPDLGKWEIKIDGKVIEEYRREGTWIYIDTLIPLGSIVEIAHRIL